ncbi:hypothetical protein CPB84DRAFT_1753425 [Gymnopilus junonius]|uniref:Uncharacterized protein n=1 Tax=Gymnopilus junonius TaxID=109634 RepID=A0A9P5N7T2_GYMJU|nr:hypothetical protein CPB84DRAFT_1753425 [Gymnopilus junonius]
MHPDFMVETILRPREWILTEGDIVDIVHHTYTAKAKITKIMKEYTFVIDPDEWEHAIRWPYILKHFEIGDTIEIKSSLHIGLRGWITDIEGFTTTIIDQMLEGKINESYTKAIKTIQAHLNCLAIVDNKFCHARKTPSAPIAFDKALPVHNPWYGIKIVIVKKHDTLKGKKGIVINVETRGKKASNIILLIQISNYDPSVPFKKVTFKHDDILEVISQLKLQVVKPLHCLDREEDQECPASTASMAKVSSLTDTDDIAMCLLLDIASLHGNSAPLSPTWDPSSQTPMTTLSTLNCVLQAALPFSPGWNPTPLTPLHTSPEPGPNCLVGFSPIIMVNGSEFKNKDLTVYKAWHIMPTGSNLCHAQIPKPVS